MTNIDPGASFGVGNQPGAACFAAGGKLTPRRLTLQEQGLIVKERNRVQRSQRAFHVVEMTKAIGRGQVGLLQPLTITIYALGGAKDRAKLSDPASGRDVSTSSPPDRRELHGECFTLMSPKRVLNLTNLWRARNVCWCGNLHAEVNTRVATSKAFTAIYCRLPYLLGRVVCESKGIG